MAIQAREFVLAVVLALMGVYFTSNGFSKFYFELNPLVSFLFSYLMFYILVLILSKMNLILFKFNVGSFDRFFGLLLITTAFYLVTTWSSCYYDLASGATCPVESPTVDGATFWLWSHIVDPTASVAKLQIVRFLTYVLTPFILVLGGGALLRNKPELA